MSTGTRSDCTDYDYVQWTDPRKLFSLSVLLFIDVLVVVGNCLVIAAVFCSHKLRSVTNFFIVSLAVADLLVGIAVLPFSAAWEVYQVWIFGELWCQIWLALDVWMCTASILNLCAISLDRYVAVTRPVTYPSIMSTKRAKLLVLGVWVLSFVICLPPLVGFNNKSSAALATASTLRPGERYYSHDNHTLILLATGASYMTDDQPRPPCPLTCELTNNAGYVVYSALGSFYLPMLVMLFFYWRIYRAAVRTTRAINQGFKTTKGIGNRFDEQRLTLRIHRGRGSKNQHDCSNGSTHSTTTSIGSSSPERHAKFHTRKHDKIKISVSYPSTENIASSAPSSKPTSNTILYAVHCSSNGQELTTSELFHPSNDSYLQVIKSMPNLEKSGNGGGAGNQSGSSLLDGGVNATPLANKKMGKRNIKAQVKRFRMETKAAKTLAIIVGLFILCWLPFFTMYVVRAFCDNCIQPLLFSILFWLGYCNSAVNPMIYALFSKDFRFAFKQIICKCFCSGHRFKQATSSRRGSDMSQLRTDCRTPSISPSAAVTSLCDGDSDHGADSSTELTR